MQLVAISVVKISCWLGIRTLNSINLDGKRERSSLVYDDDLGLLNADDERRCPNPQRAIVVVDATITSGHGRGRATIVLTNLLKGALFPILDC